MRLHVHVKGKLVAHLYRQADDYALRYAADASADDFVSLMMPVRGDAWVWPRDLHVPGLVGMSVVPPSSNIHQLLR